MATKADCVKIYDSTLLHVSQVIGQFTKPARNPDRDEVPSPNKRPDVVSITYSTTISAEIMELKPISCAAGYKHTKAVQQLKNYENKLKQVYPAIDISGGNLDELCGIPFAFPEAGEKATITFIKDETVKGLYYYKIDDGEL
ncbi:MAG: hypothetical protein IJ530_10940 [Treponema sp.]|uniref:hypothetical protein n=1 Tax=Treponema sp. TaxID=166 RepID=UPI0025F247FC|nr:hypothetical protein [Treponema sp.]MBQ8680264.1 hypothetical protein [Treponema sp.]